MELDLLAVSEAAAQLVNGHEVSINFSTATVGRRHIVDVIAKRLIGAGADPSKLTLEITETALMKDIAAAQRFAGGVAQLGCRLALDDFGTGFGGFTYLKKLQIDRLKIDVEFVRDRTGSRRGIWIRAASSPAVRATGRRGGERRRGEGGHEGSFERTWDGHGAAACRAVRVRVAGQRG